MSAHLDARRYHDGIHRILLHEWDPIGVADAPVAQDETTAIFTRSTECSSGTSQASAGRSSLVGRDEARRPASRRQPLAPEAVDEREACAARSRSAPTMQRGVTMLSEPGGRSGRRAGPVGDVHLEPAVDPHVVPTPEVKDGVGQDGIPKSVEYAVAGQGEHRDQQIVGAPGQQVDLQRFERAVDQEPPVRDSQRLAESGQRETARQAREPRPERRGSHPRSAPSAPRPRGDSAADADQNGGEERGHSERRHDGHDSCRCHADSAPFPFGRTRREPVISAPIIARAKAARGSSPISLEEKRETDWVAPCGC